MNSHDTENDRTLQPGTAHPELYDADAHTVVLSADHLSGFVAPQVLINHITQTKIYGDGRVVFLDPAVGSSKIFEGKLEPKQLEQLFTLLKHKGFWGFAESYAVSGPADMPTSVITAKAHDRPEKRVNCYAGALSAPPGFIDCFQALSYPALKPSSVSSYQRVSISQAELDAGWYWGFEYQKRLNTPASWVWTEAGRSSKWHKPVTVTVKPEVILDSSYMQPAIDGCHHIRISYSPDLAAMAATIQLDRNAISPDAFGNIGISTKMYFAPRPATLAFMQEEGAQHLFSIHIDGYVGPKLRLVVSGALDNPDAGRLLAMDAHDQIQSLHHLERR